MTATPEPGGDWTATTWKGSRLQQHQARHGVLILALGGPLSFTVENVVPFKTNFVQVNAGLGATNWSTVATNVSSTDSFTFTDHQASSASGRFYRVIASP